MQVHCIILTNYTPRKRYIIAITTGNKHRIRIDRLISIYRIAKYNATIIPRAKTALKIEIIIRDFGKKNELRVIISKLVSKNKPITPLVISKVIIPAPSEKANLAELGNNATLSEAKIIKIIPVNSLLLL